VAGDPELRREQMLRAAVEAIIDRGYADTRIADVAERTGTSPGLVIYYFKTRDQLLTEAIRYSEEAWYAEGRRRLAGLDSATAQLGELIALACLPETGPEPDTWWVLWLDVWAHAPRNPGVAAVRRQYDDRWRQTIGDIVRAGIAAGEFAAVDASDFAVTLSCLLDGLAIQIALKDSHVAPRHAYELAMRFAASELGVAMKAGR
jgi:AcrR family transcriptional regulator